MASKRDQRTRMNVIRREKYRALRKAGFTPKQSMKARMFSDDKVSTIISRRKNYNKKKRK